MIRLSITDCHPVSASRLSSSVTTSFRFLRKENLKVFHSLPAVEFNWDKYGPYYPLYVHRSIYIVHRWFIHDSCMVTERHSLLWLNRSLCCWKFLELKIQILSFFEKWVSWRRFYAGGVILKLTSNYPVVYQKDWMRGRGGIFWGYAERFEGDSRLRNAFTPSSWMPIVSIGFLERPSFNQLYGVLFDRKFAGYYFGQPLAQVTSSCSSSSRCSFSRCSSSRCGSFRLSCAAWLLRSAMILKSFLSDTKCRPLASTNLIYKREVKRR